MTVYISRTPKSKALYVRAKRVLPAGVAYGIRFFEPYPFYTARARGSKLYDVDGNEYVDFWLGHTALVLGHSPNVVVKAVVKQLKNGTQYGTPHELEVQLAEQVARMVPGAEMTRFTNSGTEANMYATRLARAYTKRDKVAKFEGGWHGGYDALHVAVKYPYDVPESAGLTAGATQDTIVLPFNDLTGVARKLRNECVAAVIIEPVLGGGGGVLAEKEFLRGLRELCDEKGILLIFDEVITGFRLAPGCAEEYFGVRPDLSVFGKILGGGFPVGAFSGRSELMEHLNSLVYERPEYSFHGGTFAGNPITMTAGLATLGQLEDGRIIRRLNREGMKIREELRGIFGRQGVEAQVVGAGSIFNVHFTKQHVTSAVDVGKADRKLLVDYNLSLIAGGVFWLPTHNAVISSAHSREDISRLFGETERFAQKMRHVHAG